MIVAYFETNSTAEIAGKYSSEEEYLKDLPRLENLAETLGFTRITESVENWYTYDHSKAKHMELMKIDIRNIVADYENNRITMDELIDFLHEISE
tara:strand:- start:1503 stop:1787 length:285 start_codon:yes stop_codon:yes gene_type:complete